MNMREKIARALAKEEGYAYDPIPYDGRADAVLDVLAEPTERMLSDGAFQIFRGQRITSDDLDAARRVWRAMCKAMLADQ